MSNRDNSGRDEGWESLAPHVQRAFGEAMREIHAGYYAAENSRYMPAPPGVNPLGGGADYHYRTESAYLRMIERARYFDRDNMVVGQGVTRLIANVLQDGFTLDADTGDEGLDRELRDRWREWAEDPEACDDSGERSWADMEQSSLRATIVDGDVFALPLASGKLQWFEGHSCRNPRGYRDGAGLVHGVELSDRRRRLAYWLTPDEISLTAAPSAANKFSRVPADLGDGVRVLHLYQPKRFSQTRGVTAFAPAVVPIQYHDDIQFGALLKAKAASFIAIFRQREIDAGPATGRIKGSRSTESQGDGSTRVIERAGLAAEVTGDPGEKLTGFSPNIPNPEFFPHASLILTLVAINLDLPLQVLLLDPTKSNFSSWRGAIEQARMRMRQIQRWQVRSLHTPVYRWKIKQWLASDFALRNAAEREGVKIFAHEWKPPRWPYIEPLTDAQADNFRIARNLNSASGVLGERGFDYEELAPRIIYDRGKLIELACIETARLRAKFPEESIDWREVAYGPTNDTTAATIATLTSGQQREAGAQDDDAEDAKP